MTVWVFDIEADNLLEQSTKIHCIVGKEYRGTGFWYGDVFLSNIKPGDTVVGHAILMYDLPMLQKHLGCQYHVSYTDEPDTFNGVPVKFLDTYVLSRLFNPDREAHGLEYWGEKVGIPKPEVQDWGNLPIETYIHRCEQDVLINERMLTYLLNEQQIQLEDL